MDLVQRRSDGRSYNRKSDGGESYRNSVVKHSAVEVLSNSDVESWLGSQLLWRYGMCVEVQVQMCLGLSFKDLCFWLWRVVACYIVVYLEGTK